MNGAKDSLNLRMLHNHRGGPVVVPHRVLHIVKYKRHLDLRQKRAYRHCIVVCVVEHLHTILNAWSRYCGFLLVLQFIDNILNKAVCHLLNPAVEGSKHLWIVCFDHFGQFLFRYIFFVVSHCVDF